MKSLERVLVLGSLGALLLIGSGVTLAQQTEIPVKSMKLKGSKLMFEVDTRVAGSCEACHVPKTAAIDRNIGMPPSLEGNIGMPPTDRYTNESGFSIVVREGQMVQIVRKDSGAWPILSVSIAKNRTVLLEVAPVGASREQLDLPNGLYVAATSKTGSPHSFRVKGGTIVALGAGPQR